MAVIGAIMGFLLPGKVSQVEKRNTIDRAIVMNEQGNYNSAALLLEEIKTKNSPLVHNELGVAYLGLNNFAKAEKEFKLSIRLLAHYGKAHQNLAALYMIMGKVSQANFEESRAMESEKFTVLEADMYNLSDNLTDQLIIRLVLAAILGLAAYNIPRLVVMFLRMRRHKQFGEQLADGLVMISNGLRAGFSLVQAIEMVAKEAKPPLNQEFELVLREHRLGSSLEDAFRHMAKRINSLDVKILVNATLILLESGGNLPERFDTLSQTIQERKRIQQKIKAMTAEGESQAWILAGLPIALALMLNEMNHEVFSLMYTTILGWMVTGLIVILEVVGLFFMLKIVRVKI